jgi:serine O-acetyltransferase
MSVVPHPAAHDRHDASDDGESLERALDGLVASYRRPDPLNNLATHTLPNRRAVVEAYHHLQHVLLLGFFTTKPVSDATLRYDLAEHLRPARELLCAQVQRAAAWADRAKGLEHRRCEVWCKQTVGALLEALPAIREQLIDDIHGTFAGDPAAESIEEVAYCYPGIQALSAHRIAHVLHELHVPLLPRILAEHAHATTGIDLHPGATIGRRFMIDHGTGVVVGATAVIGDDVRLYQGVTLGAHSIDPSETRARGAQRKRHPTLEDGVTVYAGATILGGDTVVGARSVVGGNVWLTRSVPPDSRIVYRPPPTE